MSFNFGEYLDPDKGRMTTGRSGGAVFEVSPWDLLNRILILGTEGGSYYVSQKNLTEGALAHVDLLLKEDGPRVVRMVVEVSASGRAPKNDYAIYVLARASVKGDAETRALANDNLSAVCRTGTHLFQFMDMIKLMGASLSRSRRTAIKNWYLDRPASNLAYQVMKYQKRSFAGRTWSHRDILRLARPKVTDPVQNAIAHWMVKGWDSVGEEPHPEEALRQLWAFERLKTVTSLQEAISLIKDYRLPREAIPTEWFKQETAAKIWATLYEAGMPYTALMRNLGNMSKSGFLEAGTPEAKDIAKRLSDKEWIAKSKVHPFSIMVANMTYSAGHGLRGSSTWTPVKVVSNGLEAAFYNAFGNVPDTGKNVLIALDVSGSMTWENLMNVPGLTPSVASAAMSLIYTRTQSNCKVMAFSNRFVPIDIQDGMNLQEVVRKVQMINMGTTDCSLPMTWAHNELKRNPKGYDAFIVFTDSETNCNKIHPHKALVNYRKASGLNSAMVINAMTADRFTIADPKDPRSLDVAGLDSSVPQLVTDFIS